MASLQRSLSAITLGICFISMISMAGCGDSSSGAAALAAAKSGNATISVTDEPNVNYDHVWITVKEAWFHKLEVDDPNDSGWIRFPLTTPMTIDIAKLTAGATQDVWKGLVLPVGTYRQIRVFLAPTAGVALPSLPAGVVFNNQVDYTDSTGSHKAPLLIPAPTQGIKIIPDTPIVVNTGSNLRLALDFNVNEDVIQVFPQGQFSSAQTPNRGKQFMLKARLKYFDLNNAAAISGVIAPPGFKNFTSARFNFTSTTFNNFTSSIPFGSFSSSQIMVKAEQPNAANSFRVVRNSTSIDKNGKFTIYPLPVFANNTTASYDLVITGRNINTTIITGVKARKGTDIKNTALASNQPIPTVANTSTFTVQSNVKPAGAWVTFYQTLPTDPAPFEIKNSHVDPFSTTGKFPAPVELPGGPLEVAPWNNAGPLTMSQVIPVEGAGNFKVAAVALFFNRSAYLNGSSLTPLLNFGTLTISSPGTSRTISGNIVVNDMGLNRGIMLVTNGGLIIDNLDLSSQVKQGTNPYTTGPLPGGTPDSPLIGAFYDLFALGWDAANPNTTAETGVASGINLQVSDGKADITLQKVQ